MPTKFKQFLFWLNLAFAGINIGILICAVTDNNQSLVVLSFISCAFNLFASYRTSDF